MAGFARNLEAARAPLAMVGRQVPKTKMRLLFVQVLLENGSGSEKESVSTAEWPSQTAVLAAPAARPGEHMMVSAVLFSFCFAPRARHSLRAMSRWSIGVANMSQ